MKRVLYLIIKLKLIKCANFDYKLHYVQTCVNLRRFAKQRYFVKKGHLTKKSELFYFSLKSKSPLI